VSVFPPERRRARKQKLSGSALYAADLHAPDALELVFVRAEEPHAAIDGIDARAARDAAGVRLVLTGEDVAGMRVGRMLHDQPLLAHERVRFAGERLVAIAAETRSAAERAAAAVRVDLRPLPPLLDPLAALAGDAPPLHPDAAGYRYALGERPAVSHPNLQGEVTVERDAHRLEPAFTAAPHVFEHRFTTPREHQGYLEPHACLVEPLPGGRLRVRSSNKHPFLLRAQLAAALGIEPDRLLVETPFIGGDFGGKGAPFDEPLCCVVALRTGRPVRHVMTYEDELVSTNPRQATTLRLRTAVDHDGRFLAHEADVVLDGGAYASGTPVPSLVSGIPATTGGLSTLTAYDIPVTRIAFRQVYTTSVPSGHVRAPSEVQTQFASEHHVDLIARALELAPLELRRRNLARRGGRGAGGERFRNPRGAEIVTELERLARARPLTPPARGRVRGRGFAVGVRELHGGACGVRLTRLTDGRVELLTAQPDQGGGAHEALARIVARTLGVDEDDVLVRLGDTDEAPFDMGSAASRVTWVAGTAALKAATELRRQLDEGAGGEVSVEASADGRHEAGEPSDYCFSGYLVDVELDPETGAVAVLDATLVADVGAVINPVAHAGQLQGGFAMGIGAALMEELVSEDGRIATRSLAHYELPTSLDVPELEIVLLEPDAGPGPFGAKFAGELSISGVAPAIANAISNACGSAPRELPLTPERVLRAARRPSRTRAPRGVLARKTGVRD
jgi:CO/xanthine dehydrogenase Mo-binding subunit